jgi:signal transduction histidine kinase
MVSSLRTRLWLSYAFLILVVLVVLATGLVITLQRNPLLYRQTITRIYLAGSAITLRLDELIRPSPDRIDRVLQNQSDVRKLRLVVLQPDGTIIAQEDNATDPPIPKLATPLIPSDQDTNLAYTFRDSKGTNWFYTLHLLQDGNFLLVATPRPTLKIAEIFRNEILGPFLQAALIALLLAVALSLFIGQWIANPLKRMANSARQMALGAYQPIPLGGPREVQQLGEALNEMAHKVQTTQQSQRDFVANVSHELKTPITSIQGFAQAILDGTVQSADALQQAANVIYTESGRMYRLVIDLLSLARLEAGTADLQRAPIDLTFLLKSVIDKFSIQAQHVNIALCGELAPALPIVGDGDRLAQVFTNLVDNALKYTPEGGRVTVCAAQQNGNAVVSVIDTGVGIHPDDQARIFERFYQVDKSRRGGAGRGVGLGLAIASQIVAAHGGRISVKSQPGQGTTFTVSLPLVRTDDHTLDNRRGSR